MAAIFGPALESLRRGDRPKTVACRRRSWPIMSAETGGPVLVAPAVPTCLQRAPALSLAARCGARGRDRARFRELAVRGR